MKMQCIVPLLLYKQGLKNIHIGTRNSMADTAATAADFFAVPRPESGTSFLPLLK